MILGRLRINYFFLNSKNSKFRISRLIGGGSLKILRGGIKKAPFLLLGGVSRKTFYLLTYWGGKLATKGKKLTAFLTRPLR